MPADREPDRDELLVMAYADGELGHEERRVFENRMAHEPVLARGLAEHRALELMARQAAPPEPMDTEWKRLAGDPLLLTVRLAGWVLFILGGLGLGVFGILGVWNSEIEAAPKTLFLALIAGTVVLFLHTVHARVSTLPYDPYRSVER
jgi:anti-sigma factor RsiW